MATRTWLVVAAAALLSACGSNGGGAKPGAGGDAGSDAAADAAGDAAAETAGEAGDAAPACGTAGGTPPAGTELSSDDGDAHGNIRTQQSTITIDGTAYKLAKVPLWEAVRFSLEHPAKILGFRVMWTNLGQDAAPDAELTAGLYADFGHNGFDFWSPDPLWTGTRCTADIKEGQWTDYVFDQPVVVDKPGLVYVAEHSASPGDPVFAYDNTTHADCTPFDACPSAFNLPGVPGYYNGASFPFQRDFLVRLIVEYTDNLQPENTFFQQVPAGSGNHISFADYDNDGWDDALISGKLFHNDHGSFSDVTASAGLDAAGIKQTGGVFGDYDNDGCLDLLLFSEDPTSGDALLHSNCNGSFSDVTAAAGISDLESYEDCGDPANTHAPSAAAAWLDIDADGYLDLYLANFICWAKNTFYVDTIFHNNGDGSFSEWTGTHGFSTDSAPSRGAAPVDADADGDIDLFVNEYRLWANRYYRNNGNGNVSEVALANNLAGHPDGTFPKYYGHTIGAAWGDIDNDGDFDLVAANLAHPRFFDFSDKTQILLNDGKGQFTDTAGPWGTPFTSAAGLRYQETYSVPALADFNGDGNLDLVLTAIYDGRPTDFYWGHGDGTFSLDSYHAGITTRNGWGVATADYDNDGDPDVFATDLFQNQLPTSKKGHWLEVRVVGNAGSNWAAIGATVRVDAGGKLWLRQVQGGTGKGGQDSLTLDFGLGGTTSADNIVVTFPGGKNVTFAGPIAVDQRWWLSEDGTKKSGWAP